MVSQGSKYISNNVETHDGSDFSETPDFIKDLATVMLAVFNRPGNDALHGTFIDLAFNPALPLHEQLLNIWNSVKICLNKICSRGVLRENDQYCFPA